MVVRLSRWVWQLGQKGLKIRPVRCPHGFLVPQRCHSSTLFGMDMSVRPAIQRRIPIERKFGPEKIWTRLNYLGGKHQSSFNVDLSKSHEETLAEDDILHEELSAELSGDEDESHLRTKLYPVESDETGTLAKLYEVESIQEVFDCIEKLPDTDIRLSTQALVTLWDLQKLLFRLELYFESSSSVMNKTDFIAEVKAHPVFENRILGPTLEGHTQLEDEPLSAAILCLNKMNFSLHQIEPLMLECLRRKDSLSLPALSRLSVALRTQSTYGILTMGPFMPLVLSYVETMTSDIDVRLVSILLRNSHRLLTQSTLDTYINKVDEILKSEIVLEMVTYCKIMLLLLERDSNDSREKHLLVQKVGMILTEMVQDLSMMELLSLQKVLLSSEQEPYPLVDALLSRYLRLIEEEQVPRLGLLAAVAPHLKLLEQRKKMGQRAMEFMNTQNFSSSLPVLFTIVKNVKTNEKNLYDKYWNEVSVVVQEMTEPCKRALFFGKNYLNFTHSVLFSYRNFWLETLINKHLHGLLNSSLYISPPDFASMASFLLSFDKFFDESVLLQRLGEFVGQFKASDLYLVAKGVDGALRRRKHLPFRRYETIMEICNLLEDECALRLSNQQPMQTNSDLTTICRLLSVVRKVKGESSLFDSSLLDVFFKNQINGSRDVREISTALQQGNYFYPEAVSRSAEYIFDNLDSVNPETVERFLGLTYNLGWVNDSLPFHKLADFIHTHWEKLGVGIIQSAISLGFHCQLKPELVNNIFTVEFLDSIDQELASSFGKNFSHPMKLRTSLMKLNRIVCIDVPECNLPFFHKKFCEGILASGKPRNSYLHNEVRKVLAEVVGDESAVIPDVCSELDYYYSIDFVLEFDASNKPIKKKRKKKKSLSFFRDAPDNPQEVRRKVAVLLIPQSGFTKHIKSLKGGFKLKQRHLEMLGYHVVKIDPHNWNCMYMSEGFAKHNFLESEIYK